MGKKDLLKDYKMLKKYSKRSTIKELFSLLDQIKQGDDPDGKHDEFSDVYSDAYSDAYTEVYTDVYSDEYYDEYDSHYYGDDSYSDEGSTSSESGNYN